MEKDNKEKEGYIKVRGVWCEKLAYTTNIRSMNSPTGLEGNWHKRGISKLDMLAFGV